MLVSHRKKFIFTKTVKTAGTSVESFFEKYCFPENEWVLSHGRDEHVSECGIVGYRVGDRGTKIPEGTKYSSHMSAAEIKEALPKDIWSDYFKFTVIRNPFDKLVSAFYHFEKARKHEKYKNRKESDVVLFREWVAGGGIVMDRNKYMIEEGVAVDYFIRYESLVDDIVEVCNRVNVTDFDVGDLPDFKSGIRAKDFSLLDMYDGKTEKIVREKYQLEIDLFGYDLK